MIESIRNYFTYDYKFNKFASRPFVSTPIGVARIAVTVASLAKNIVLFSKDRDLHGTNIFVDLRSLFRGLVELIPIGGGLISWQLLTPAQKLAFRVQKIYQEAHLEKAIPEDGKFIDAPFIPTHPAFNDFINGCKVKMSADEDKIQSFLNAFKAKDGVRTEDPIFSDKKLPFYALAAFARQEIDCEDMATLLHFYVAKRCFTDCKLMRLMDNTKATKDLGKALSQRDLNGLIGGMSPQDYQDLAEQLRPLPQHKLIFWTHEALVDKTTLAQKGSWQFGEQVLSPAGSLSSSLIHIGGILTHKRKEYNFPFSVERMVLNVKYGKNEGNFCLPKLGLFTARQIKEGVEMNQRLCATYYPGAPFVTNVHNSLELPSVITKHDRVHAHILQAYPSNFLTFAKNFRAEFAQLTGFEMSKEIWEFTELVVASYFNHPDGLESLQKTKELIELIQKDKGGPIGQIQWAELFWRTEDGSKVPTVLTCCLALKFPHLYRFDFAKKSSDKQRIWSMQQHYRYKPTTPPPDDQLVFQKVKTGRRKNTIDLVLKSAT